MKINLQNLKLNSWFAFSKMDINSFEILGIIQISDDKKAIK